MSDINKVTLTGRVAGEPDIHHTDAGRPVVNFSVAVSYDQKNIPAAGKASMAGGDANGNTVLPWRNMHHAPQKAPKGEVSFVEVVVLGKLAESCSQHLKKGRKVMVEGRLQQRKNLQVLAHQVYYLTTLYEGTKKESAGVQRMEYQGLPQDDVQEEAEN